MKIADTSCVFSNLIIPDVCTHQLSLIHSHSERMILCTEPLQLYWRQTCTRSHNKNFEIDPVLRFILTDIYRDTYRIVWHVS